MHACINPSCAKHAWELCLTLCILWRFWPEQRSNMDISTPNESDTLLIILQLPDSSVISYRKSFLDDENLVLKALDRNT